MRQARKKLPLRGVNGRFLSKKPLPLRDTKGRFLPKKSLPLRDAKGRFLPKKLLPLRDAKGRFLPKKPILLRDKRGRFTSVSKDSLIDRVRSYAKRNKIQLYQNPYTTLKQNRKIPKKLIREASGITRKKYGYKVFVDGIYKATDEDYKGIITITSNKLLTPSEIKKAANRYFLKLARDKIGKHTRITVKKVTIIDVYTSGGLGKL